MWSTSGYQNQKLFLENALKNKKYAHAYLFCGPDDKSKLDLAKEFAGKILNVQNFNPNPDLITIGSEKLKIEDMRNLIAELSLKPFYYQHKVAIIESFENVNVEAANSILKTLEEPNPSTILILLAKNKLSVLPTISSRCQVIYFNQLIEIADGAGFIDNLARQSETEKLLSIKEFAEKDAEELAVLFEDWMNDEHKKMLSGNHKKYYNLQNLIEALQGLKQNLNKKLILEKLFLRLV